MSKKRKKRPVGDSAAERPENGVNAEASEPKAESRTSESKVKKSEAKKAAQAAAPAKLHPVEEKLRNMDDRTWFRSAVAITVFAAFLRYFMLLLRPVHHDEGVNGWMLTNLLRDNRYQYDPSNYHGPTIYFIAYPLMKIFGLTTMPLRSLSSFFGLMMVVLVFFLRRYLGNVGTLLAAFFLAISPGMVFVSRYFIHEIFFVFFQLSFVVACVLFIEKRKVGQIAVAWMWILLIVSFLPISLMGGKYLGGENETLVSALRFGLFWVVVAIVWYLMKFLTKWDEGRPIYFLLAAASLSLIWATKETGFISIGTMAIAIPCVWIWQKIGPGKTLKKTLQRNALIGTGIVIAAAAYYYPYLGDGLKYLETEFLKNAYRPQTPFLYYGLLTAFAVTLILWVIYLIDLGKSNTSVFEEPVELSWKDTWLTTGLMVPMAVLAAGILSWAYLPTSWFVAIVVGLIALSVLTQPWLLRKGLVTKSNLLLGWLAAVFFWYLWLEFFASFFLYKEGFWKSFEAYNIWTKTGTKEHSQNGTWAYLKWGSKGENAIILGSLIGSLVAMCKNKHKFATFCAAWAAGVFAAYMIIPYKTPWCALNYVLPMCLIAGYGLNELILSNNRRLNLAAYAFVVVGTALLGYQTYVSNWVRYDDDQMPYVYAHTRRGFVDMINQIDHYAEKSGKGAETVIDITSPDYWPMTWYVVDYKHVGYHGRVVDTKAEIIVTKKKDQDTEALAKYSENYRYVGMYPLRPGVDMNLLVRKDIAEGPCTDSVQDGVQKGGGVVIYNTQFCTRDLSVIPSVPMTP